MKAWPFFVVSGLFATLALTAYIQESKPVTPVSTPQPVAVSVTPAAVPPPAPAPPPVQQAQPLVDIPPPPPPPFSVKRIANDKYLVTLPKSAEFSDTGIPVITNTFWWVQGEANGYISKWVTEVAGQRFFSNGSANPDNIRFSDDCVEAGGGFCFGRDYSFRDTFKFKVAEDSRDSVVTLTITTIDEPCRINFLGYHPEHPPLHAPSQEWRSSVLASRFAPN